MASRSTTRECDEERRHHDVWYRQAIDRRFFDREGFRRLERWNLAALSRLVPVQPDMTLLSIGCGLGQYELALARRVRSIVGIDISSVAVDEARRRAKVASVQNVEFRCTRIEDFDPGEAVFDGACVFGVLHHLADPDRAELLRRVYRWIRPNGWFYARDPNANGVVRRVASPFGATRTRFHSPEERPLDPRSIASSVAAAGFREVRVDYTDVIAGALPWIIGSSSRLFWSLAFGFDRAWLSVPFLRPLASQFAVAGTR